MTFFIITQVPILQLGCIKSTDGHYSTQHCHFLVPISRIYTFLDTYRQLQIAQKLFFIKPDKVYCFFVLELVYTMSISITYIRFLIIHSTLHFLCFGLRVKVRCRIYSLKHLLGSIVGLYQIAGQFMCFHVSFSLFKHS